MEDGPFSLNNFAMIDKVYNYLRACDIGTIMSSWRTLQDCHLSILILEAQVLVFICLMSFLLRYKVIAFLCC